MKIYKITFNQYTNGMMDTVRYSGQDTVPEYSKYITCTRERTDVVGYLTVVTDDLSKVIKEFQDYGNGIKLIEYIGIGFVRNHGQGVLTEGDK